MERDMEKAFLLIQIKMYIQVGGHLVKKMKKELMCMLIQE